MTTLFMSASTQLNRNNTNKEYERLDTSCMFKIKMPKSLMTIGQEFFSKKNGQKPTSVLIMPNTELFCIRSTKENTKEMKFSTRYMANQINSLHI